MSYIALSIITLLFTLVLSIYILIKDGKKAVNRNFSFLIMSSVVWIFSNFMADISKTEFWNLFWSKSTLIGPILLAYFFYKFSLLFPKPKPNRFYCGNIILAVAVALIALTPTHWNIDKVELVNGAFDFTPGFLYIPFCIYFVLVIILASINIFRGYYSFSKLEQIQVRLVMIGIMLSVLSGLITNLVLPLLGISRFVSFGPYFILFFIIFASYTIIRRGLFDIKIIATDLFALVISIVLFVKVIISENPQDLINNSIIFAIVGFFAIFLVRSVSNEVKQREQIEKMAGEVKKAYDVEKIANEELVRLDGARTQFLMATQHHLRTPLTGMRGYAELILDGTYGKVSQKIKDAVIKLRSSTEREIKVVNELLDVSQFQLGKEVVRVEKGVSLDPIFKEIIEELKFEADAKKISLKIDNFEKELPLITADSAKLKVALYNLVDNAIKYTKVGGVSIGVQAVNGSVKIAVKDTGMGVSKENLESDFFDSLFERGDEARKMNGTGKGIGLYITSQIIKAHKGKIWAESEGLGKGTTFYIELPV
jgi:signal transduction histidine kinase